MDPVEPFVQALCNLETMSAIAVINHLLTTRPELAPAVIAGAVPDLTYAPTRAITERRSKGIVKAWDADGDFGWIHCAELQVVFGQDVFCHATQLGTFQVGTEVSFAVTLTKDNKPQAYDVQHANVTSHSTGGPDGPAVGEQGMVAMGGVIGPPKQAGGQGDWSDADPMGLLGPRSFGPGGPVGADGKSQREGNDKEPQGQPGKELGTFQGIVKSFNASKGFGFIQSPAVNEQGFKGDVFMSSHDAGQVVQGAEVIFDAYINRKGQPQVKNLRNAANGVAYVQPPPGQPARPGEPDLGGGYAPTTLAAQIGSMPVLEKEPEIRQRAPDMDIPVVNAETHPYQCMVRLPDGCRCPERFATRRDMLSHVATSGMAGHGEKDRTMHTHPRNW